jgi:galactose-1-phosphate uridylyltransferase
MAVRRLMFDALSEEEKAALAAVIDKLLARTDHAPTH